METILSYAEGQQTPSWKFTAKADTPLGNFKDKADIPALSHPPDPASQGPDLCPGLCRELWQLRDV